ncbi:hypothetical protein [Carnobacterium sp. FSL W8-0810]|uniref:hypothetical protein n=1 Tax=Carnobacterium sp. FSL W8-0810 TaxID=2954705 RepID=UPI0030FB365C
MNSELVIALIAAASTIITVFLTNFFTGWNEMKSKRVALKEKQYIAFLKLIIVLKGNFIESEYARVRQELSETIQMMYLIGSDDVIIQTKNLMSLFSEEITNQSQEEVYSKLIKSMRIDLYGKRKVKDHPSELNLITFS